MKRMENIIELFAKITGHQAKNVSPLYGGLNSVNYLIDDSFVLRIKGTPIDHFYSAEQEKKVETLIAPFNLGVNVLFLDSKDGTKLTQFVQDTHFLNSNLLKSEIKKVAATLATLHSITSLEGINPFDMVNRFKTYKSNSKISCEFPFEKSLVDFIFNNENNSLKVLCHNDLVRGNLLFKSSRLYLIDYEYSGINNPMFDLASFITENDINDPKVIQYFLNEYTKIKSIQLDAFNQYCQFLDLLWYYWAKAMFLATNVEIYNVIAQNKLTRLNKY